MSISSENLAALTEQFFGPVIRQELFSGDQGPKSRKARWYSRSVVTCHQANSHGMNSIGRDNQVRRVA